MGVKFGVEEGTEAWRREGTFGPHLHL